MNRIQSLLSAIMGLTVLLLLAGCTTYPASYAYELYGEVENEPDEEAIGCTPYPAIHEYELQDEMENNSCDEAADLNKSEYIMTTRASNWHGSDDWEKVYIGDEFLGLRLEAIYHDTVFSHFIGRYFRSVYADFSGEIVVTGDIIITLRPETISQSNHGRLIVREPYLGLFPILTDRGHTIATSINIGIRNRDELLTYLDFRSPETGEKELVLEDVVVTIINYSVCDVGHHNNRITATILLPIESYTEPVLLHEWVDVDYITVAVNDVVGFQDFRAGDEFMRLTVDYAESQRSRWGEGEDLRPTLQSAIFSGQLRLRGSMALRIFGQDTDLSFYFHFGVAEYYDYYRLLPLICSWRGGRYVVLSAFGRNENVYQLLDMLNIDINEIEVIHSEIEVQDLLITINRIEWIDEGRFGELRFGFEDIYSLETIQ